jgi:xanthine dehydrogenase accessory factor
MMSGSPTGRTGAGLRGGGEAGGAGAPPNKLPREWAPAVMQLLEREPAVVRIVIAEIRGSAPREPGAFMLVGRACVEGTVGGGRLEWESIAAARQLLDDAMASARLNKVVLGADLGQCCGGVVAVWLERFTRDDLGLLRLASDSGARGRAVMSTTIKGAKVERQLVSTGVEAGSAADVLLRTPRDMARPCVIRDDAGVTTFLERLDDAFPVLWLYGAGHVGQALAGILAELPLRLTWIDSRAELFPATVPEGVRVRRDADSLATVPDAPPGAYFLVMTHSHPLDFALCQAILTRNDFAWLGLIGSASKAARFRSRLARAGVPAGAIARLVCPIGIEGIESKWPAAIAVAVAAQVMQQISAAAVERQRVGHGARAESGADTPPLLRAAADCGADGCATCGSAAEASGARSNVAMPPAAAQRAGGDARSGETPARTGSDEPAVVPS